MTDTGAASSNNGQPDSLVDLSTETGLRVVDACWEDENLMDALNLTNTLSSFVNKVDFSALDALSLDPKAMFSDFYDFKAEVAAFTPENFGLNKTTIDALDRVCNKCTGFKDLPTDAQGTTSTPAAMPDGYCENKCADMQSKYAQCRTIQDQSCAALRPLREGYDYLVSVMAEANTRFKAQASLVEALSDHVTSLRQELDNTRKDFDSFAASLTGVNKYSSCHFVVDFFERTRSSVCGSPSALSGMLWFAACLAIVSLLSMGLIVSTMCINCRIGGIGQKGHNHMRDMHDRTKHHVKKGIRNIQNRFNHNSARHHGTHTVTVAPAPRRDTALQRTGSARIMNELRSKQRPFKQQDSVLI